MMQWVCSLDEIRNKLPAVGRESEETPSVFDTPWDREPFDCLHQPRVCLEPLTTDNMTQILQLPLSETTFGQLEFQFNLSDILEHYLQVSHVERRRGCRLSIPTQNLDPYLNSVEPAHAASAAGKRRGRWSAQRA